MSKPKVMIRGIYATALTQLFLSNGFSVTNPSKEILERFKCKFDFSPAEVTVTDREDLQGVYIKGEAEKADAVASLLKKILPDAIIREKIPLSNLQVGEKIRVYGGFAFYEAEFPLSSKKLLDELRSEVTSTIIGHHHLKIIASDKVKEAEAFLSLYPEERNELSLKIKNELIYDRYENGKTIFIEHAKLNGEVLNLSEGKILSFKDGMLTLKRLVKGKGFYDGINERKEEGDYIITEAKEESWILKHSYFSKDGELKGELYNINTPIEFYPDKIRYVDLEIDIINKGSPKIIDLNKLNNALEDGFINEKLTEKALKTAKELIANLRLEFEMPLNIKGVIFDLDGTLIKSKINFLEMKKKIIEYFNSLGLQPQLKAAEASTLELIEFINNKVKDEKLIQEIFENVNKIMNEVELESLNYVTSIEGVKEALVFLKNKGFKIGVLTRSCREYALKSLEKTNLKSLIDYLIARDDVDKPKPNPYSALILAEKMNLTPNEILMVGDHALDFLCAKKAGMKFIGVLTGFSSEKEFKKIGCKFIKSINEFPSLFK